MRMSSLVGRRQKDRPSEATTESHSFMLRGAYIRQLASGIYSLLTPAKRIVNKIEQIIREEMDSIDGQEILMPVTQPRELWEESGRYESIGAELARWKDRNGHDMVLAMTHEETVLHLVRNEITSYKQLPAMVYQIQSKFRDELRARAGLIRVREFTMKDAYSFHSSSEDLQEYYDRCFHAYERIFKRTGLSNVVSVASDTGIMGGDIANGFMAMCSAGEDTIACCKSCFYKASSDVAKGNTVPESAPLMALQKVHTPGMSTINDVASFLKIPASQTAKAVFFQSDRDDKPVFVIIRGDLEVNEFKLAKLIGVKPEKADDDTIIKIGAVAGYASPLGIDKTKCHIICDHSIRSSSNLACGANEKDFHYINFNLSRDLPEVETVDIATVREGDLCPHCKDYLTLKRGIEVGKIFQLGTKYTKSMNMQYLDEHGSSQTPFMGCYGIGIGRLMATVLELHHDDWGPKWPMSIAPWQVHICALKYSNDSVAKATNKLNQLLSDNHVEVLVDDRNERPGVQFADADLLGIPIRLIVSDVNLKDGLVELKLRGSRDKETVLVEDVAERVKEIIDRELVC